MSRGRGAPRRCCDLCRCSCDATVRWRVGEKSVSLCVCVRCVCPPQVLPRGNENKPPGTRGRRRYTRTRRPVHTGAKAKLCHQPLASRPLFKMRSVPTWLLQMYFKDLDGVLLEIRLGRQPLSVILALRQRCLGPQAQCRRPPDGYIPDGLADGPRPRGLPSHAVVPVRLPVRTGSLHPSVGQRQRPRR